MQNAFYFENLVPYSPKKNLILPTLKTTSAIIWPHFVHHRDENTPFSLKTKRGDAVSGSLSLP